jgi:hypothetical protein
MHVELTATQLPVAERCGCVLLKHGYVSVFDHLPRISFLLQFIRPGVYNHNDTKRFDISNNIGQLYYHYNMLR